MKAIIWGANGQDGYYLSELLRKKGIEVIGVSKKKSEGFLDTDITSYTAVAELIKMYQPDFIFHLAANSTTAHYSLFENNATICTGTLNILEAVKNFSSQTKVFISGSGLQFLNTGKPIKETAAFEARDAYSVSRIHSVFAARYFRNYCAVKTYVGYFFNHDSPRRTERHMAKKIAAAALRIANGSNEKLEIGDITTIKEWAYAGEVVEGIWFLVNQDEVFEANLGSGIGYSIEDWIKECFGIINKNWKEYVVIKPGFTPEYKQLVSDSSLIHAMGWQPKVTLRQLAQMIMKQDDE
jgi:GDPmannose 4,6-dehydratase